MATDYPHLHREIDRLYDEAKTPEDFRDAYMGLLANYGLLTGDWSCKLEYSSFIGGGAHA